MRVRSRANLCSVVGVLSSFVEVMGSVCMMQRKVDAELLSS
jgi:hypothetical protein